MADFIKDPVTIQAIRSTLERCPFCRNDSDKLELLYDGAKYFVSCSICHASGPKSVDIFISAFLWNTYSDHDLDFPVSNYSDLLENMEVMIDALEEKKKK